MERVGILINKLQEQLNQQAETKNMLVTAQMLHAELLQLSNQQGAESSAFGVNIMVPFNPVMQAPPETNGVKPMQGEKKIPELPQAPPAPVEIKEEEKKPAPPETTFNRTEPEAWTLNPVEVPTLAHQEKISELNDTISKDEAGSLNDRLKENKPEVANSLKEVPVKDLKKAISINDRHLFIHDLFRDDETMYERSIKTINSFYIFAEAEYWIQRELKLKLGWDIKNEAVKLFDQLVKRRFS